MEKTVFEISKMDCPSEENLIRLKLNGIKGIKNLDFDLDNRLLTIYHHEEAELIEQSIEALNLGSKRISTTKTEEKEFAGQSDQKRLLWTVLLINFSFFIIELTTGLISKSMGLVADSLDMLADSFVYGISLMAVGKSLTRKKSVARIAGYFQIILASVGFLEIVRRFTGAEKMPDFSTMIVVSALALVANAYCLYLLQKSKSKDEAHMKASLIFTSNDIIINLGVIVAGLLVLWLNSGIPDLVIGAIVFGLVIQGALRILNVGRK
jgi:Co/Zn/Cd efflux system component